ncbi:MAG: rRNA maturation RNase YbeY [Pseudomonadota bacterium]
MLTDTIIEDIRWQDAGLNVLAEAAAQATFAHLGLATDNVCIAVLGCDDTRIADLNREFRSKPAATNVLSWPSETLAAETAGAPPLPFSDPELGDIAISYDTCAREAEAAGKAFDNHVIHLVVHGVLHLLGYDHIRDPDATLMEETERRILGTMGIDDPY